MEIHEVTVTELLAQAHELGALSHVLMVIEGLQATVVYSSGLEGAVRIAGIRDRTGLPLPDCYVLDSAEKLGINVAEQNGGQLVSG